MCEQWIPALFSNFFRVPGNKVNYNLSSISSARQCPGIWNVLMIAFLTVPLSCMVTMQTNRKWSISAAHSVTPWQQALQGRCYGKLLPAPHIGKHCYWNTKYIIKLHYQNKKNKLLQPTIEIRMKSETSSVQTYLCRQNLTGTHTQMTDSTHQSYIPWILPLKDLGIVILNHTRSFTSNPELGAAIALDILYMGVVRASFVSSPERISNQEPMTFYISKSLPISNVCLVWWYRLNVCITTLRVCVTEVRCLGGRTRLVTHAPVYLHSALHQSCWVVSYVW